MPMSSSGLVVTANSNARTVKAPNPIKSKGRRPQLWACRPAHGAARATNLKISGLAFSRAPLRAADSRRLERATRLRAGSTRRRVAHQGPRSSAPHHSRPLNRRQCVDVDVASRMLSENFDSTPFVLSIPCAHPQQQASTIHLLLQIMRMVIADPFGQD